jgi:dienelactone hydrolase
MDRQSRRRFLERAGLAIPTGMLAAEVNGESEPTPRATLPAGDPRDLPSQDARWEVHTLDTPRPAPRLRSRAEWEARAARLREQILAAAGLWPMPARAPLRAQVFDHIEQERFTVEKAYFESYPHFFSTGNLYRPKGGEHQPPYPGVLCPHGHWNYGRLEHSPGDLNGGSIPQRCMNLALQGYVVLAYDMVGYNDSFQVPHYFSYDEKAPWGLSPEGLRLWLWGVSQLGLQLWNSLRALDFITSLPDVDPDRIGVTGASGGGTQTFLLTAVDDRVKVSAPVNMISHFMQGGCICENGPNLRLDTDNMELGALAAPRPLLMVSTTGDWTRDTARIEYPAIAAIYELLGARDRVAHQEFTYDHNYNRPSREAVYRFFARWLPKEPAKAEAPNLQEQGEFHIDPGHLLVFSRRLPPADALDTQGLMDALVKERQAQLAKTRPERADQIESYRQQFAPVYRTALMAASPASEDLRWWSIDGAGKAAGGRERLIISRISVGDRVPGLLARPSGAVRAAALIVHPEGAEAALGRAESPSPLARALARQGLLLLSVDTFLTGEARAPSRKPACHFFPTYNRTDDMQRVQDILTALAFLEAVEKPQKIAVVAQGLAGLWCLLARPLFNKDYAVVADATRFDNNRDGSFLEKLYIPLLRRAGDFQTAALLAPASPLLLHNTGGQFASEAFQHAYALRGASDRLRVSEAELPPRVVVEWLMKA